MKKYLTCVLLCVAISLISLGIHNNDIIVTCIGGFFVGVYNVMMYYKED